MLHPSKPTVGWCCVKATWHVLQALPPPHLSHGSTWCLCMLLRCSLEDMYRAVASLDGLEQQVMVPLQALHSSAEAPP